MLPNTIIRISPKGDCKIEGMEQSNLCYKLRELANSAGIIISENKKEHAPVHQIIKRKGH